MPAPPAQRFVAAILASWLLLISSCGGSDTGAITFTDGWSRQPAAGQSVAAVFGVVNNPFDREVMLVAVSSPVSDRVEIHESVMDDKGAMAMHELPEGVAVPADSSVEFKPGGVHIMLFDIDAATYPTDVVDLTLVFNDGTSLDVQAEVKALGNDSG